MDPPNPSNNAQASSAAALPVTVVAGMKVVPIDYATSGTICGIAPAFCIYQLDSSKLPCVAAWHELALANVCPAPQLLPVDVDQCDRQNASAAVLRELLFLEPLGLTSAQAAAKEELLRQLCAE